MNMGKYAARVADYAIVTTKSGDPMVNVKFVLNQGGEQVYWNGTLKPGKGQEITIKALLVMGLSKDAAVENLADGPSSGLLDLNKDVEIEVQMEDFNGKVTPKVRWVNEIGGAKFKNAMSRQDFKARLGGLNLRGALKAAEAEVGVKNKQDDIESIPF